MAYLNAVYYVVLAVEISKQVASYNWWSTQNQVLYLGYKIPEESVSGLVYKANECSFVLVLVMLSQILFSNCECKSLHLWKLSNFLAKWYTATFTTNKVYLDYHWFESNLSLEYGI